MEMGRFRINLFVGIYANAMSHCHTLHDKRAIRSKSFYAPEVLLYVQATQPSFGELLLDWAVWALSKLRGF